MAIPDYKLSAVLCGHSMDVRCVATTTEYCILSASRDRTAKLWHPEGVKDFVNVVTYKGHKNFVSCVCWLPPCEAFPEGLVITGSNDNTILGYNLQDASVQITLNGHENVVCWVIPGRDSGVLLRSGLGSVISVFRDLAPFILHDFGCKIAQQVPGLSSASSYEIVTVNPADDDDDVAVKRVCKPVGANNRTGLFCF